MRTVANVLQVCAGRVPRDIVNPEVLGALGRNSECLAAAECLTTPECLNAAEILTAAQQAGARP